jgi:1-acyl-sn-glycerol-3-phosphate acyltransferase
VRDWGLRLFWLFGKIVSRAYLTVFHGLRARGTEHLPDRGPAIIASNHQCFMDPNVIGIHPRTRVWFMAHERYFNIPGLGVLLRLCGAFPADPTRSARAALRSALGVLREGGILGIFPEGTRGDDEGDVGPFLEGAAHIALRSGATVYPATITGAVRAWSRDRPVPRPGRIRVTFHPPIVPPKEKGRDEAARLTAEIERRIRRPLGPSSRALRRIDRLYGRPSPSLRLQEVLPFLTAAHLFYQGGVVSGLLLATLGVYAAYLAADIYLLRPHRTWKFLRDASPIITLAALHPMIWASFPQVGGGWLALGGIVLFPAIQAIWSGQPTGLRWILGSVLVYIGSLTVVALRPEAPGPGWLLAVIAFIIFHTAHSVASRRAPLRWWIAMGMILGGGLLLAAAGPGVAGPAGIALAIGGAAFVASRLLPSRGLWRENR